MTDSRTLDLAAVFSGRSFPKDEVVVYLDEAVAYKVHKINKEISRNLGNPDRLEELSDELKAVVAGAEGSRYVIHVTGVSRQDRKLALEETLEKYPAQTNAFGQIKNDPKANDYLADLNWKLHIEKIAAPGGIEHEPSLEDIVIFRNNAPDAVIEIIENAINELSDGAKSGFETIVQEADFLSSASPKA